MNIPSRNRQWLKEIQKSYAKAEKKLASKGVSMLDIYQLAPELAAKNRAITSQTIISQMLEAAKADVEHGKSIDPGSEENYIFHFASAYIYSHCIAGLVSEMECDKVMEYVNQEWDLFPNA